MSISAVLGIIINWEDSLFLTFLAVVVTVAAAAGFNHAAKRLRAAHDQLASVRGIFSAMQARVVAALLKLQSEGEEDMLLCSHQELEQRIRKRVSNEGWELLDPNLVLPLSKHGWVVRPVYAAGRCD